MKQEQPHLLGWSVGAALVLLLLIAIAQAATSAGKYKYHTREECRQTQRQRLTSERRGCTRIIGSECERQAFKRFEARERDCSLNAGLHAADEPVNQTRK